MPLDADGDGVTDSDDNCPFDSNPGQEDANNNGIGNACDNISDSDSDGLKDSQEDDIATDPDTPTPLGPGINTYTNGEPLSSSNQASVGESVGVAISPPDDVDAVGVTVTDPNGELAFEDTLIPESPVVFSFKPNSPGEWTIAADYFNGTVLTESLTVPFFVVPESPIGVIALVVSSLATLLWFIRRRNVSGRSKLS